jgi:hypothetical protein
MKNNNYIFLLFTPGIGGNHLTNLLSISLKLCCNLITDKKNILEIYKNPIVHPDRKNLQKSEIKKFLANFKNEKDIILCGHIGEYLFLDTFFKNIKHKKFITITGLNSSSFKKISPRIELIGQPYNYLLSKFRLYQEEQAALYQAKNISKLLDCEKEKIIEINLSDFLSIDIIPLLIKIGNQLEYTNFYDLDFCQELHGIWLTNNNIV